MSDIMNGLFADTFSVGVNIENDENNHIINEAVILDKLNGDTDALNKFFDTIGSYGARDNILSESANIDCCIGEFENGHCAKLAALLAVAKESNSKDYELYTKALMLMKACIENMKNTFGNIAKERLDAQIAEVESNPRVVDAIESCTTCDK